MENIVVGSINVFSNVVVAVWTRHQVAERTATRAWVAARTLLVDTAGNGCGMRGHRHVCVCVCGRLSQDNGRSLEKVASCPSVKAHSQQNVPQTQ